MVVICSLSRCGARAWSRVVSWIASVAFLCWPAFASGNQDPPPPSTSIHEHVAVTAPLLTPTRETSGTAWLPPVTPMYGVHRPWRGWDIRLNGAAAVQALYEPGDRHRTGGAGTRQAGSVNWAMFTARRRLGDGRFGIRTMLSGEPWTIPGCGSLSFLTVGEVCEDDSIHDRQQPHDFFMELAVDYDHPLRGTWRWQLYAGLAGEPALGPPGYPHRPSAMGNPMGPITHHWLDATHVTFGVLTVAVHNQRWKAEASAFNGREADNSRINLDLGSFDSISGRLSYLPTERLALQVSAARLREVSTDFPFPLQDPAVRITASVAYHVPLRSDGIWATTVAYGANNARQRVPGTVLDATTSGGLLESSVTLANRHTIFGRGEVAGIPGHHLHAFDYSASILTVGKVQVGYVRHFRPTKGVLPGIGGSFAVSIVPPALADRYSGRTAPSFAVFVSLQAARHQM